MRTLNQVPKDQTNLISFPEVNLFQKKYKGCDNQINDTHLDSESKDQTADEKCTVCDLGI